MDTLDEFQRSEMKFFIQGYTIHKSKIAKQYLMKTSHHFSSFLNKYQLLPKVCPDLMFTKLNLGKLAIINFKT